jgi:polyisoprenoid-binding protein YceI
MRSASPVLSLVSSEAPRASATNTATTWAVDADHSHVGFKVRHMMVSIVSGGFRRVRGRVVLDGSDLENTQVEAVVDAASIDTNLADRDEHLRSAEFLDAENHPHLTFRSKRVESASPTQLMVVGDLEIRGISKEVTFKVEWPGLEIQDPRGNFRRGATATARIRRRDFGLNWNIALEGGGAVLGGQVLIQLSLELIRGKDPEASELPAN